METGDEVTGPINLGNPDKLTIRQLAEAVLAPTGSRSGLEHHPLPQDDPGQRQPDITLAQTTLGWTPSTDLQAGLARTIAHFRGILAG
jgi:UDP-glucuronate decarboxylase